MAVFPDLEGHVLENSIGLTYIPSLNKDKNLKLGPLVIIMILEKNIAPSLPALHLVELMNSVQNFEKKNEDLKNIAFS